MSYILEALKKSEQERQQEQSPSRLQPQQTIPLPAAREKTRQINWLYIAATFFIIGGVGFYLNKFAPGEQEPKQPDPPQITIQPLAIQPTFPQTETQTATQAETAPQVELSATATAPDKPADSAGKQQQQLDPKSFATTTETRPTGNSAEVLEPTPLYTKDNQPDPPPDDSQSLPSSTRHSSIPFLKELSPSFQKKVPEFKLAGHVFSQDPKLRMILINNTIVRENDVVEKHFVLEEITNDGIILRSGDTRFRLLSD